MRSKQHSNPPPQCSPAQEEQAQLMAALLASPALPVLLEYHRKQLKDYSEQWQAADNLLTLGRMQGFRQAAQMMENTTPEALIEFARSKR